MAAGAFWDIESRRIPNWLMASGVAVGAAAGGLRFIGLFAAVVIVFFPLYLCRMIGAGDIKVMALIVGFLGPFQGADVLVAGFCIGAAVSLFKLLRRGILQQRLIYFMVYIRHLFQTKQIIAYFKPERDGYDVTIPFVACLFLGTIISWWWK